MPTKTRWTKAAAGNRWSVFVSESAPQLRLKYSITLIAEDENILRERVSVLVDYERGELGISGTRAKSACGRSFQSASSSLRGRGLGHFRHFPHPKVLSSSIAFLHSFSHCSKKLGRQLFCHQPTASLSSVGWNWGCVCANANAGNKWREDEAI